MTLERNHAAERIARVEARLAETKRKMSDSAAPPTDRASARELFAELDEMLRDLNGAATPPLKPQN
jgi:hypothetical protein